jgi:hypothetical protein
VRRGGRVETEYLGQGPAAELVAERDGRGRARRLAAQADRRELERLERETFRGARERAARVDRLVTLGLEASGLHRHARGPWRRRRMGIMVPVRAPEPGSEAAKRIGELCRRVSKADDRAALAELRRLGEEHPEALVDRAHGDLARAIEGHFLDQVFSKARSLEAGVEAKLRLLRAELAGSNPPPALRLAVEAAAYRWLDHWIIEMQAASSPGTASAALDRRRNWAHRRYLQALAAVERIRRLTRPRGPKYAVQIIQNGTVSPPALGVEAAGEGRTFEVTDGR